MMKNILIVSHSSELAGAERSMLDLFAAWEKEFHITPTFIIKGPVKSLAGELKRRGWQYYSVIYSAWSRRVGLERPEDIYRNALYDSKAILEIEKIIKKVDPDVVMTNTLVAPWGAMAAALQNKPHVWFVREYGDLDHGHTMELGREKTFADIDYFSDLVVTNSQTLRKHLEQYINPEKLTTVYTPFSIKKLKDKAAESVKSPFKDKDSLKIVITGRIAPSKGQDMAAEAVGRLAKRGKRVELAVVGESFLPADKEPLLNVIKKYNIGDKVHLVGFKDNPLPYVAASDIGIMASKMEAFGRTTFEYLCLGKPVIGLNGGATPEMVRDDVNGYLYKDVDSMVQALESYYDARDKIKKHARIAEKTAQEMLDGEYGATSLFKLTEETIEKNNSHRTPKLPHYARTWIGYPSVAQHYLDKLKSGLGFKFIARQLYLSSRQLAKRVLVAANNKVNRARNEHER